MKIGVISDTHGSLAAWKTAYERYLKDTDLILHCGDVLYHGPRNPLPTGYNPAELAKELNSLATPLIIVKGNCDTEVDQMVLDHPLEAPYAHLFVDDLRILAQHGHLTHPPAKTEKCYDLLISGHTHLPGISKKDGVIYLNPGSPCLPKNSKQTPTVALIEAKKITLWNIQTGEKLEQMA